MQEALKNLLAESQTYINRLEGIPTPSPELQKIAMRSARELQRSIHRFESKLILMATIGSVKSGKSTLSNCLARRELCATQLGIETTRLPLIVLASNDGTERIELFSPKAAHELDEKELFELVIDHLRGIEKDNFARKVTLDRRPLTPSTLEAWGQGRTPARCAAIYLVEPDATLLQSGIALIDMPGMDGLNSNWHDEKLHAWMNQNADYFLLVQSSFAALTPDTSQYLKQAMEQSPRPIRVVQNRIEAQFWEGRQGLNMQQMLQQHNTQKNLSDILRKIIPSSSVNAGLAWWQLEQKVTKGNEATPVTDIHSHESHLAELESDILSDLSDSDQVLEKNSLDHLHKTLEEIDMRLKEQQGNAENHLSHLHLLESQVKMLLDKARLREAIETQNLMDARLRSKYLADEAKDNLNRRLDQILNIEIDGYFPKEWLEHKRTGDELNRIRIKLENDLAEVASEQETHVLAPEKYCELTTLEKEKITACAQILQRRSAEDIEKDLINSILEAWVNVPLNCAPFSLGELNSRKVLGIMDKKYSYMDVAPQWRSSGRDTITKRLYEWHHQVNEQFNTFINQRIVALENCLLLEWERYHKSEQVGRTSSQAKRDINATEQLREQLAPVLHRARQLHASK